MVSCFPILCFPRNHLHFFFCFIYLFFLSRSQKLHSNPQLPGFDSSALITLSFRLRLYPCRCEELQLSIQLVFLCGGTGFAVEEGSLGVIAVTNRSDTNCLRHRGSSERAFLCCAAASAFPFLEICGSLLRTGGFQEKGRGTRGTSACFRGCSVCCPRCCGT